MRCEFAVFLLGLLIMTIKPARSQFHFTLPPVEETTLSIVEDGEGNPVETPRGIFHYSDTEHDVQSSFKVPDFQEMDPLRIAQDLMSAASKAQTRRKSLGGFNIPLPIGTVPMNLQVSSDTRSGLSVSEQKQPSTTSMTPGPAKEAFEKAKAVCLQSNPDSCDEALDTYYRVKYGTSLVPSTSSSSDDPSTELATMMVPGLGKRLEEMNEETPSSVAIPLPPPPSYPATLSLHDFHPDPQQPPQLTEYEAF